MIGSRLSLLGMATLFMSRATTRGFVNTPFYRMRPSSDRHLPVWFQNPSINTRLFSGSSSSKGDAASADSDTSQNNAHPNYWIAPEELERLKESVDIVSVVESYNLPQFQRKGDNNRAMALCPFHADRNPSLHIDGTRKLYKCFACGAGGDVFKFVRDYSALDGGETMSFGQAVRHVAKEFGDGTVSIKSSSSYHSKYNETERQEFYQKKQRLLLANAAAADFYANSLMTLPSAGPARLHLRNRGLAPTTVRTFAMGYAPDGYFGRATKNWGEGSLVERLRELDFTPDEIVDAGLAIRTKQKPQWSDVLEEITSNQTSISNNNDTAHSQQDEQDYSALMDRFRGRLMVPIFDSGGKHVVGFGGRILDNENAAMNATTKYKPPKYVNSPESLVFQKSHILFGQYLAKDAIQQQKSEQVSSVFQNSNGGSVVIVEGYMDAIALSQVGVKNVVACMGTALSLEQLANAARTAGSHGGQIILCLDGDEAGINAVERLCSGTFLSKTCDEYVVEIVIATLPEGIKDPAEYIESRGGKERAGDSFQNEVVDTAKDWTVWYLELIMSRYDSKALRGGPGSFSNICERVSDFLACFGNPAERTKRAFEVAGILADIVAGNDSSSEGSNALRIQLESDLVAMTSRKATARESVERRIETLDGVSPQGVGSILAKMSSGQGMGGADEGDKLSGKALQAGRFDSVRTATESPLAQGQNRTATFLKKTPSKYGSPQQQHTSGKRKMRARNGVSRRPPLTPHFSGFTFDNPHDAAWLGVPKSKRGKNNFLTLGGGATQSEALSKYVAARRGEQYVPGLANANIVYFNSNEYHGNQFLTQEAMSAGYSNEKVARDASIIKHGVGTLVKHKPDKMVVAAEDRLLTTLLEFKPARNAMKSSLASSEATGSEARIEWSSPARQWLFDLLVDSSEDIPAELFDSENLQDLRDYLADKPDAPVGAFRCSVSNTLVQSDGDEENMALEASSSELVNNHSDRDGTNRALDSSSTESANNRGDGATVNKALEASSAVFASNRFSAGSKAVMHPFDAVIGSDERAVSSEETSPLAEDINTVSEMNGESENIDREESCEPNGELVLETQVSQKEALARAEGIKPLSILNGESENASEEEFSDPDSELVLDSPHAITVEADESTYIDQVSEGTLDMFFVPKEDIFVDTYDGSIARDVRAELDVQEALSTLLQASAMKRHAAARSEWFVATSVLHSRMNMTNVTDPVLIEPAHEETNGRDNHPQLQTMELDELKEHCHELAQKIQECSQTAQELELSARQIRSRMLDYGSSGGLEGRLSHARQEELAAMLDDHLANLPEDTHRPDIPGSEKDYAFGSDEYDENIDPAFGGSRHINDDGLTEEEAFQLEIEQIETEWREWSEDGYSWSAESQFGSSKHAPNGESTMSSGMVAIAGIDIDEDEEESLEDFDARIHADYGDLSTNSDVKMLTKKRMPRTGTFADSHRESSEEDNSGTKSSNVIFSQSSSPADSKGRWDNDESHDVSPSVVTDKNEIAASPLPQVPDSSPGADLVAEDLSTSTHARENAGRSTTAPSTIKGVSDELGGSVEDGGNGAFPLRKPTPSNLNERPATSIREKTQGNEGADSADQDSKPKRPIPPILEYFGGFGDDDVLDGTVGGIRPVDYDASSAFEEIDNQNGHRLDLPPDSAPQQDDFLSTS